MNIHIVHLPVLQSLASQMRMYAPRKAKWLTNDVKINRFWVLNPGQKVIAEFEALGTALEVLKGLEVLEVDVLEDDAIFDLRPEGHKRDGPTRVSVSQICWPQGDLESAGPYLTMGVSTDLNIFRKQYRNKIQTELFWNYDGFFFLFSTHKSSDYASSAKLK